MKHFLNRLIIVMAMISMNAAADDSPAVRRNFKEFMRDAAISTQVKYRLTGNKLVKKRNMNVDVRRGVVTITGFATSEEERAQAGELAAGVKGVVKVDNFLRVAESGALVEPSPELKPKGRFGEAPPGKAATSASASEGTPLKESDLPVAAPTPEPAHESATLEESAQSEASSAADSKKLFPWIGETPASEEGPTPLMHTREDGTVVDPEAAEPPKPAKSTKPTASSADTDDLAAQAAEELKRLRKK